MNYFWHMFFSKNIQESNFRRAKLLVTTHRVLIDVVWNLLANINFLPNFDCNPCYSATLPYENINAIKIFCNVFSLLRKNTGNIAFPANRILFVIKIFVAQIPSCDISEKHNRKIM